MVEKANGCFMVTSYEATLITGFEIIWHDKGPIGFADEQSKWQETSKTRMQRCMGWAGCKPSLNNKNETKI